MAHHPTHQPHSVQLNDKGELEVYYSEGTQCLWKEVFVARGGRIVYDRDVRAKVTREAVKVGVAEGMKPDLRQVTACVFEHPDFRSAISLLHHVTNILDFGDARLFNLHQGWSEFNYWAIHQAPHYVRSTSHALFMHLDGYPLHPEMWRPEWLEYDYIGAPWEPAAAQRVGNDGFALKSVRLMRRVADLPYDPKFNGDEFTSIKHRELLESEGFRFADVHTAAAFSTECAVSESVVRPFGFHSRRPGYPVWRDPVLTS